MKQDYQVTLLCADGRFRPVSCLVSVEQKAGVDLTKDRETRYSIKQDGIKKICCLKRWTKNDLVKYNYSRVKVRLYDKVKIETERAERYESIKEKKYATGEWKRPKEKNKKD